MLTRRRVFASLTVVRWLAARRRVERRSFELVVQPGPGCGLGAFRWD